MLQDRNKLSKQNGLDFSGYLGKQVSLYTYAVEGENGVVEHIDLVIDGNEVVGFWTDKNMERPDFNMIVGVFEAIAEK